MSSSIPKYARNYDHYYQKLITATIIRAGMGSANEYPVIKQTEAALTSVFPVDDINLLSTMTIPDRESELIKLMKMTAGIRLYNRELDPEMGAGIPDGIQIYTLIAYDIRFVYAPFWLQVHIFQLFILITILF